MTKIEFINQLRNALVGSVSSVQVNENVSFYENYINTQIRMGRSEAEVLEELGDPRLIAKSIIACENSENNVGKQSYEFEDKNYQANDDGYGGFDGIKIKRIPGWLVALIVIAICIVVLVLLFAFVVYILPIMLVVGLIVYLVKYIMSTR